MTVTFTTSESKVVWTSSDDASISFTVVRQTAASSGDVVGPASSVDGRAALFDGTTGKLLRQSTAAPVLEGDARLTNSRTPTAHAASHADGGTDEISLDASQLTTGTIPTARLASGTANSTTYLRGDQTWQAVTSGVTDHGALTGLADDDHKQYQRAEPVFTTTDPFVVTDESFVITTGAAVTMPDAASNTGRDVTIGSAAQEVTISAAGTDTLAGLGVVAGTYTFPFGSRVTFTAANIGGNWLWVVSNREGPDASLPIWYGQGIADGNLITLQTGVPAWTTGTRTAYQFLSGTGWTDDVPVLIPVKNTSGSVIAKGAPVYATGTVGDTSVVEIAAADADDPTKMPAVGLTESQLSVNGTGYVVVLGTIRGVNTDGYTVNQTLYVATTAGGLTGTKPTGTSELIQGIGRVTRVNTNSGEILVLGAGRTNDIPNAIDAGKLTSGTVATARLGTGTASASTYLRGDQTWAAISSGWTLLHDTTLAVDTASLSYDVTGYDQLHVIVSARSTRNSTGDNLNMTLNGDTSSVYSTNAAALTTVWTAGAVPATTTNTDRHQHVDIRLSLTDGYTKAGYSLRSTLFSTSTVGGAPTLTGLFSTLTGAVTSVELAGNLGDLAAGSRIRVLGMES